MELVTVQMDLMKKTVVNYIFSYNIKSEMCKVEVLYTFVHITCINQKQQQKTKCMNANIRIIRIFKFKLASMLECVKSRDYTI